MKTFPLLATSCLALSVGVTAAIAATASSGDAGKNAAGQDYARLSIDGAHAFQDIGLARLAIFDGKPAAAVKLVADAQQAMGWAKIADSVFMKAAADLKTASPSSATLSNTETSPAEASPSTTKITWVPIDGQLVLDETLAPTPANTKAVAEANDHLRNGEPDKAREALKVASVTADYILAVAPLKQSTADVAQASKLLASNDYYGASQALRQAQDGVRYDTNVVRDAGGAPSKTPGKPAANG